MNAVGEQHAVEVRQFGALPHAKEHAPVFQDAVRLVTADFTQQGGAAHDRGITHRVAAVHQVGEDRPMVGRQRGGTSAANAPQRLDLCAQESYLGTPAKECQLFFQAAGMGHVVGVHPCEKLGLAESQGQIRGNGRPLVWLTQDADPWIVQPFQVLQRAVVGTVIHDQEDPIPQGLPADRFDCLRQMGQRVVNGHEHGYVGH